MLAYPDLDKAIDWLCNDLGFTLRLRIGDHRAQLNVGDSAIAVRHIEAIAVHSGCSVMVRVEDSIGIMSTQGSDARKILSVPADYFYGEGQYSLEDLAGNHWTFSQSIVDVDPREWGGIAGKPRANGDA